MNLSKIDSCKHRSPEQYTRQVKICCGRSQEVTAFDCVLREIYPLSPDHCNQCNLFQPKSEDQT